MPTLTQQLIPGIVGISTYVDYAYQKEMQHRAVAAANSDGPINQLRTVTVTLDFNLLVDNLKAGRRDAAEDQVAIAARALEAAGADFVVVTSGTTSTLTARARDAVSIPFLDLAEACWKQAKPASPVGLLSTRYAAAGGLFQAAAKRHETELLLPSTEKATQVDLTIFSELIRGAVSPSGLEVLHTAITELTALGAKSVILGNTDLTLVKEDLQSKAKVPLVDSTTAHARDAAHTAMNGFS